MESPTVSDYAALQSRLEAIRKENEDMRILLTDANVVFQKIKNTLGIVPGIKPNMMKIVMKASTHLPKIVEEVGDVEGLIVRFEKYVS